MVAGPQLNAMEALASRNFFPPNMIEGGTTYSHSNKKVLHLGYTILPRRKFIVISSFILSYVSNRYSCPNKHPKDSSHREFDLMISVFVRLAPHFVCKILLQFVSDYLMSIKIFLFCGKSLTYPLNSNFFCAHYKATAIYHR